MGGAGAASLGVSRRAVCLETELGRHIPVIKALLHKWSIIYGAALAHVGAFVVMSGIMTVLSV